MVRGILPLHGMGTAQLHITFDNSDFQFDGLLDICPYQVLTPFSHPKPSKTLIIHLFLSFPPLKSEVGSLHPFSRPPSDPAPW